MMGGGWAQVHWQGPKFEVWGVMEGKRQFSKFFIFWLCEYCSKFENDWKWLNFAQFLAFCCEKQVFRCSGSFRVRNSTGWGTLNVSTPHNRTPIQKVRKVEGSGPLNVPRHWWREHAEWTHSFK